MAHYYQGKQIVGWGPTVQEIDALSERFEQIVHVGCLFSGAALSSSLPYQSEKIKVYSAETLRWGFYKGKNKSTTLHP